MRTIAIGLAAMLCLAGFSCQSGGSTTAASNLSRAADNPGQLRCGSAGRRLLADTGAAIAHLPAAHLGDTGCQRRLAGAHLYGPSADITTVYVTPPPGTRT